MPIQIRRLLNTIVRSRIQQAQGMIGTLEMRSYLHSMEVARRWCKKFRREKRHVDYREDRFRQMTSVKASFSVGADVAFS